MSLVLMMLLTLLGVALLSLSSISLRGTGREDARMKARANARMALIMAVGELQKSLGPDKAISAPSGILGETPAKPGLTGVWKSRDYTPELQGGTTTPDYAGHKIENFQGWMVSTATPEESASVDFAKSAWKDPTTLVLAAAATYGGKLPTTGPLRAGKVPLTKNGKEEGAYAWHVSDESVKARINLFRDPSRNATVSQKRALLAGHRPDVSMVSADLDFLDKDNDANAFKLAIATRPKITSLHQAELSGSKGLGKLTPLRDVITPYSMGVLADARLGGLKKDLTSLFERSSSSTAITLPAEYNNLGLYATTHGISGESDPVWNRFASYYNIFKQLTKSDSSPTYAQAPFENTVLPKAGSNPVMPKLFSPGPVIAKVQVLFSLITRPPHGGADNGQDGQLHLMYTPLVTLHNPYNINISFDMLKVSFQSLPVGFNFSIDGSSINGGKFKPFNELYDRGRTLGVIDKSIVLKIANWRTYDTTVTEINGGKSEAQINSEADKEDSDPKDPVVMKPGQTLLCAPYIDPASQFGRYGSPNTFFDFGNQLTRSIKTKPGFFGNTVGFDLDWLKDDVVRFKRQPVPTTIGVVCGAAKPTAGGNASFEIKTEITAGGRKRSYGGIQMIYPDLADLEKALTPAGFSTNALSSFVPNEGGGDAQISQHSNAKPFALFSAFARNTSGGVNEAGTRAVTSTPGNALVNGKYAGKPFLFHNPAVPVVVTNLKNEKLGAQAYELSLEPVTKNTMTKLLQSDNQNRTRFLTGNTADQGTKSGSYLEIASGPLEAIADLRRSNVIASSFAPGGSRPIANSVVPPMMKTNSARETGTSYRLLDHSVLANHALYDSFYFSTFGTNTGKTPEKSFTDFMDGSEPLLSQAFQPHLPARTTVEKAGKDLYSAGLPNDQAYRKAAQYQLVQGAFNVNSTSVQAWKARLASMRQSTVPTLSLDTGNLANVQSADSPIFAMTLPNGAATNLSLDAFTDKGKENRWNGFRQLTDAQLEELATRIVKEVRKRGPFLSMSEFVNRRIGSNSEETRQGALEAAIEAAKLNDGVYGNQVPIGSGDISGPEYGFATPEVVTGNPAAGAPGWISQGDLMKVLEPAATVRSDTFVIRVCGEAKSENQTIRAYAEAVVQRLPDYVDPSVEASASADDGTHPANQKFGRRMEIISFRWLSNSEI
ncbi:MAG: hypothetical protein V4689_19670 [Verrucomicrobiota bacterium]